MADHWRVGEAAGPPIELYLHRESGNVLAGSVAHGDVAERVHKMRQAVSILDHDLQALGSRRSHIKVKQHRLPVATARHVLDHGRDSTCLWSLPSAPRSHNVPWAGMDVMTTDAGDAEPCGLRYTIVRS